MTSTDLSNTRAAPLPVMAVRGGVAGGALLLAAWVAWGLPAERGLVWAVSLAYAGLLLRWPHAWALVLPALIPLYDLGLWTGRYLLTEFDVLVLITLARHYLRPGSRPVLPPLTGGPGGLGGLLLVSYLISGAIMARGITTLTPANINFYLEPLNAVRVAKGFVWAWLLWPLLRAARAEGAAPLKHMLTGFACAGLAMGVVGLWERGIFKLLADGTSPTGLLSDVLGFSGEYRVTGLFSDMHVGGTSVDGFLILAVPMAAGAALAVRPLWLRLFCALGAAGALYAAMLTVSRGLLAGILFALLLLGLWFCRSRMRREAREGGALLLSVPLILAAGIACYLSHAWGGNEGVAKTCLLLAAAAAVSRFEARRLFRGAGILAWAVLLAASVLLLHESFVESKWSTLAGAMEWPAAIGTGGAAVVLGALLGHVLRRVPAAVLGGGFIAFVGLAGIVLPAVAGTSMTTRLARSEDDLGLRQRHWQAALDTVSRDGLSLLLGKGVGSYPSYYFSLGLGEEGLASGLAMREGGASYLRQGRGDFNLAQRIHLEPGRQYRLTGRARSDGGGRMTIKVCPRNVLFFNRYTPQCVQAGAVEPGADWQSFDVTFRSGRLGRYGPLFLPTTLQIQVSRALLDYTDLAIRPADAPGAENAIANGDFSHGIDRWFLVSDFNHLAWHTKNVFLHMLFEQGVFGLVAFLALLALGLWRAGRAALAGSAEAAGLTATLAGLIPVGLFGTMVDNPTVALAIYLVMLAAADLPALMASKTPHPESMQSA